MTLENWIDFSMVIVIILGSAGAIYQWWHSNKIKRSEIINQFFKLLRYNKEIREIIYQIEYDKLPDDGNFHDTEIEYHVDKLLTTLNYLCYINKLSLIYKKELSIFKYEIARVVSSEPIQNYLWNLFHFSIVNEEETSYKFLIEYAENNQYLKSSFYNKDSSDYIKNLNF